MPLINIKRMYTASKTIVFLLLILGLSFSGTKVYNQPLASTEVVDPHTWYDGDDISWQMRCKASPSLQPSIDEYYKQHHKTLVALDERRRENKN